MPTNAHVNGGSHVTLVSDMEEDTLLWSQVASSCGLSLDAITAPSITSQNDIPEVSPDIEENGNGQGSSSARSVATTHERRSRRSSARESSCDTFADVPVHRGVSEDRHGRVETEGAQIVAVAGLKSLSKFRHRKKFPKSISKKIVIDKISLKRTIYSKRYQFFHHLIVLLVLNLLLMDLDLLLMHLNHLLWIQ